MEPPRDVMGAMNLLTHFTQTSILPLQYAPPNIEVGILQNETADTTHNTTQNISIPCNPILLTQMKSNINSTPSVTIHSATEPHISNGNLALELFFYAHMTTAMSS